MTINTKSLVAGNFFKESEKLAEELKLKENMFDVEMNWLISYNMLKDYYENNQPKDEEYYFIIGEYYKDKPIGSCTKSGLIDVHKEEPGAIFVKCSKEEADIYSDSEEEILPNDWKSRKIFKFNELV